MLRCSNTQENIYENLENETQVRWNKKQVCVVKHEHIFYTDCKNQFMFTGVYISIIIVL